MTYANVSQLPLAPDLAVILAPPAEMPAMVDTLGKAGTRGVVVISPGFAELGEEGLELQQRMLDWRQSRI
jgi:acyl-CoA synthetase (NDP forming)